jgi:hypothetical protein
LGPIGWRRLGGGSEGVDAQAEDYGEQSQGAWASGH